MKTLICLKKTQIKLHQCNHLVTLQHSRLKLKNGLNHYQTLLKSLLFQQKYNVTGLTLRIFSQDQMRSRKNYLNKQNNSYLSIRRSNASQLTHTRSNSQLYSATKTGYSNHSRTYLLNYKFAKRHLTSSWTRRRSASQDSSSHHHLIYLIFCLMVTCQLRL